MQVRRKETAKIERRRLNIFNSEWARTFPGIRASNQSAAKVQKRAHNFPSCANRSNHDPTLNFPFTHLERSGDGFSVSVCTAGKKMASGHQNLVLSRKTLSRDFFP